MIRRLLVPCLVMACALLAIPARASTPNSAFADEAFHSISGERQKAGKAPLARLRLAELAAQLHAMDMANREYMAHYTATSSTPVTPDPAGYPTIRFTSGMGPGDRLVTVGYSGVNYGWGENAAYNYGYGSSSPAQAVTAWMNSAGHRANILDGRFVGSGMGCAVSASGKVYYAQVFVVYVTGQQNLTSNSELWGSRPPPGDTTPPGSWSYFGPRLTRSLTPSCSIRASDGGSGLNITSAQYRFSRDGGGTWSDWITAACTGAPGTRALERLTGLAIPFNKRSNRHRIQFRIQDQAGNTGVSRVFAVTVY